MMDDIDVILIFVLVVCVLINFCMSYKNGRNYPIGLLEGAESNSPGFLSGATSKPGSSNGTPTDTDIDGMQDEIQKILAPLYKRSELNTIKAKQLNF